MVFLIDENLPVSVGKIFKERGFAAECINDNKELRGKSDEVIFEYAITHKMIIVTRDLGFANPMRFALNKASGMIILRFPSVISIVKLCDEAKRLISSLTEKDFQQLIIIEPGIIRMRPLA